jgi:hypothetical protein
MLFPGFNRFNVKIGCVNLFLVIKIGWVVLTVSLHQNQMREKVIGLFQILF